MVSVNSDNISLAGEAVEKRTFEIMAEFEEHFRATVEVEPSAENRRNHVFQAWAMQKIAGLQICVEEIVDKFNTHVGTKHHHEK